MDCLRAIFVAHQDAVFPRIPHVDIIDSDRGTIMVFSDDKLALASNLFVISKPENLRGWVTINEACQAQSLRRETYVKHNVQ